MTAGGNWTEAENEILRRGWPGGVETETLAAMLPGRTPDAVAVHARKLGLARPRWYWTVFASRSGAPPTEPRDCLTCGQEFQSEGKHNRLCGSCREAAARSTGEDYSLAGLEAAL